MFTVQQDNVSKHTVGAQDCLQDCSVNVPEWFNQNPKPTHTALLRHHSWLYPSSLRWSADKNVRISPNLGEQSSWHQTPEDWRLQPLPKAPQLSTQKRV